MAHGAATIQPLFQMQSDGRASNFDKISGAWDWGLGAAGASDHYIRSLASANSEINKGNLLISNP